MRRKIRVAVVAAVAFVAGGAAYLVISDAANTHRATMPAAGRVFAPRAAAISRELHSGNFAALRDAIALPAGVQLDRSAAGSLAALKGFAFETSTFRMRSLSTAVVRAVVTDTSGTQRTWTMVVVRVAGEWKLAQSTRAPS